MLGLEVAVGYAVMWVWRKARRVAEQLDAEVDVALDAALKRVHALVAAKLGGEPAFQQLEAQAGGSAHVPEVAARTQQRVELALADAVEHDTQFATQLAVLIAAVQQAEREGGVALPSVSVTASGVRSVAIGGNSSGPIITGDGVSDRRQP